MECNKDEAIRARELSEEKMANNDFEGARNVALKAKKLHPELENITQLLSICDVHCSAQKRVGSEKDWYAILQIERLADESTIKKQYRRLALALHPDKNRLPGAEAAFKLISEAHAILSDATKKSSYDTKIRITVIGKPPHHYMNRNFNMNQQGVAQKNIRNGFKNLNQHQTTGAGMSSGQEVFWTCCPFCQTRYCYQREHVNKNVHCQKCQKCFMSCEISAQGVPSGSKLGQPGAQMPTKPGLCQPAAFHEKVVLNQGYSNVGVQNTKKSSSSHAGSQGNASTKAVQPEPGIKMGNNPKRVHVASSVNGNGGLKTNGTYTNYKHGGNEYGDVKNISRKKGRKMVVESSESYCSSDDSDAEDETNAVNSGNFATNVDSGPRRRSSRIKHNVAYNESDDEGLASSIKRQKVSKNSEDNGSKLGNQKNFRANANFSKSTTKENVTAFEKSLRDKNAKHDKEAKMGGETSGTPENIAETVESESDSDLESDPQHDSNGDGERIICPDSEFNDFDKERDPSLFKVDQIWACYDEHDGMPTFYAKVTKASSSPFEVSYKWLEAFPITEAYEDWVDEQPVGCGTYKLGRKIQKTSACIFSHQMILWPGKKKGPLIIYPRKGEIWALFMNWDISWCSNPENHKEFKYEVVEVLSDFIPGAGINVCYLDKVFGFVSLFQKTCQSESNSFWIRPDEIYQFSHRVPSFKMTGSERDGVPIGSFELDPASLPLDPELLHFPGKEINGSRKSETGVPCSPPNTAKGKGKSIKSESTSNHNVFVDLDGCY